jgi:hypothetical protein
MCISSLKRQLEFFCLAAIRSTQFLSLLEMFKGERRTRCARDMSQIILGSVETTIMMVPWPFTYDAFFGEPDWLIRDTTFLDLGHGQTLPVA